MVEDITKEDWGYIYGEMKKSLGDYGGEYFRCRYRAYRVTKGSLWIACWSLHRISLKGEKTKGAFYAFLVKKTAKGFSCVKHTKRQAKWRAKDRAFRWISEKMGEEFVSTHQKKRILSSTQKTLSNRMSRLVEKKWAEKYFLCPLCDEPVPYRGGIPSLMECGHCGGEFIPDAH